jgi:serine/threonine protein phosphatase 1
VITHIAFVGDVHGNLAALTGMIHALGRKHPEHIVFLGDYLNKAPDSAKVIQLLLEKSRTQSLILLRGNHEAAFLTALDTGDLAAFLKIGGATTIRSYVGGLVGPEVFYEFRKSIPPEHLELIRGMPDRFESTEIVAAHKPRTSEDLRFAVSAHVPVGLRPVIRQRSASIDTGCGSATGRLTAFLWPSRGVLQVDAYGISV